MSLGVGVRARLRRDKPALLEGGGPPSLHGFDAPCREAGAPKDAERCNADGDPAVAGPLHISIPNSPSWEDLNTGFACANARTARTAPTAATSRTAPTAPNSLISLFCHRDTESTEGKGAKHRTLNIEWRRS